MSWSRTVLVGFCVAISSWMVGCGDDAVVEDGCPSGRVQCGDRCIEPIEPTLSSIQAAIFEPTCNLDDCHGVVRPKEDLVMSSAAESHANMVGQPSEQVTALSLVVPGDASIDVSYLMNKLTDENMARMGTEGEDATIMPVGSALCTVELDAIRQWITAGAQNN